MAGTWRGAEPKKARKIAMLASLVSVMVAAGELGNSPVPTYNAQGVGVPSQIGRKSPYGEGKTKGQCVDYAENFRPDLKGVSFSDAASMAITARNAGFDVNATPQVGSILILPNVQATEIDANGKAVTEVTGHAAVVEDIKGGPNGTRILTIRDSNFDKSGVVGKAHLTYTYNKIDGSITAIKKLDYDDKDDPLKKHLNLNKTNIKGVPEYSGAQFIHQNSLGADAFYKQFSRQPSKEELVKISQDMLAKIKPGLSDNARRKVVSDIVTRMKNQGSDDGSERTAAKVKHEDKEKKTQPADAKLEMLTTLRDEARRENQRDLAADGRLDALSLQDRQADHILSRSAIDAHGNRVRMEGYVLQPAPTQVEHLVLDRREGRTDSDTLLRTYSAPLLNLADIPRLDAFAWGGGNAIPSNQLVRVETDATNGTDHLRNLYLIGMAAPLAFDMVLFRPSSYKIQHRLTGPGYDVLKEDFQLTNTLFSARYVDRLPGSGGILSTYYDVTWNRDSSTCNPCTINWALAPTLSFDYVGGGTRYRIGFADGTNISREDWILTGDGKTLSPTGVNPNDPGFNIEFRLTASEFQGRDIDIVYPSTFFTTSPAPGPPPGAPSPP